MAPSLPLPSELIEHHLGWPPGSYRARQIKRGLTNTVFALRRGSERVALRVANPDSERLGVDRDQELRIHRAAFAAGLATEVLFASREILITDWLPQRPWRAAQLNLPTRIDRLAPRLQSLWQLPVPSASRRLSVLLPRHTLLHALDAGPQVICHGDLSAANILGLKPPQFLDFEFAARASPIYELAQLVVSNQLPASSAQRWLKALELDAFSVELAALLPPLRALNAAWLRRCAAKRA